MNDTATMESGEREGAKPFFSRVDRSAFWTATILSFLLYFYTLAPTVSVEDGGELAVAADYLGVPHPPGYPIWTLTTWFFQWAFHWVRYYGQPDSNVALVWKSLVDLFTPGVQGHPNATWGAGLASAVAGALACGLLALLVSRSGTDLVRGVRFFNERLGARAETLFAWSAAVGAGLLLACSPVLWSQSVIVEVYSLNAFFQILVLLLIYRWMCRPKERKTLYLLALVFGLGLTNHQTLLFMGLALAAAVLIADIKLFRDFVWAGLALGGLVVFNILAARAGKHDLLWSSGPDGGAFWVQMILFLLVPLIAWRVLPNGRVVCSSLLWAYIGIGFYIYLFFAGEQNPPMNWGYPRTWEGFMHAVTRGQYEPISPANIFSERYLIQMGLFLTDMRRQFTLPVTLIGFLPFCAWRIQARGRSVSMIWAALLMIAVAVPLIIIEHPLLVAGQAALSIAARTTYMLLIAGVVLLSAIGGAHMGIAFVVRMGRVLREPATGTAARAFTLGLFILIGVGFLFVDWMVLKACFQAGTAKAVLFGLVFVTAPVGLVALVYHAAVRKGLLAYEFAPRTQHWMVGTGVAFFSVSFLFLAILNNAPDVQTQFIGRVQFIQAHAIYALWLGYGALFGAAVLAARLGGRILHGALALAILASPGLLLWQNAYDETQVALLGGAEQNEHDFGWLFGYWSMRGAKGILEEISEIERATYPNPEYPGEMKPDAIFYGGTDPGRFVPTYMIFSAHVREDVCLITQNALADATYMNVLRDLYGERIWIPDAMDINRAFTEYAQTRVRQAGDNSMEIKDGRVSVQGVQAVMEINGILTRQIFDRNKARHAFYVEESYVIPWMYPYLLPHGLILELCPEPVGLPPERIRDDRAFWDWLTARLMKNPKFLRDIPARKSFSKLRTAIAGVYMARQLSEEAEYAFRQAVQLYPPTPEANLRLADLYIQQGRLEDALQLAVEFSEGDPHNDRIKGQVENFRSLLDMDHRRRALEAQAGAGDTSLNLAMELLGLHRQMGRVDRFGAMASQMVQTPGLPKDAYIMIARMAAELGQPGLLPIVEAALRQALAQDPSDLGLWSDLLVVQMSIGQETAVFETLDAAVRAAGPGLIRQLRQDPRFGGMVRHPDFQKRYPPQEGPRGALSEELRNLIR
jgi:tetratricopeptide (TPR) repeat protein